MPSRLSFPLTKRNRNHHANSSGGVSTVDPISDTTAANTPSEPAILAEQSVETNGMRHSAIDTYADHRHHPHPHNTSWKAPIVRVSLTQPVRHRPIQKVRLRAIDTDNDECAVCSKAFEVDGVVSLLPCGHYFCQDCTSHWFVRIHSTTCPLCRYDVSSSLAPSSSSCHRSYVGRDDQKRQSQGYDPSLVLEASRTTMTAAENNANPTMDSQGSRASCGGKENAGSTAGEVAAAAASPLDLCSISNFDLIMAKTLHARRDLMLRETGNSSWCSTFSLDNEE